MKLDGFQLFICVLSLQFAIVTRRNCLRLSGIGEDLVRSVVDGYNVRNSKAGWLGPDLLPLLEYGEGWPEYDWNALLPSSSDAHNTGQRMERFCIQRVIEIMHSNNGNNGVSMLLGASIQQSDMKEITPL